jgi:hypothetical protein
MSAYGLTSPVFFRSRKPFVRVPNMHDKNGPAQANRTSVRPHGMQLRGNTGVNSLPGLPPSASETPHLPLGIAGVN